MDLRGDYYILNADGDPVAVDDVLTWAQWFEENRARRQIARDVLPDGTRVSTVFLGLDHGYGLTSLPILFETMVFDAQGQIRACRRYATRADALDGHQDLVMHMLQMQQAGPPQGPGPEGAS
jgi:hypothetical protein